MAALPCLLANCSITRVWAVLAFERRVKGHLWTAQGHRINDIYTLCVVSMLCKCIKVPTGRRTTFKNNIHVFFSLNDSSSNFLHFLAQLDHFFNCLSANLSCRYIHSHISPSEANSFYSNSAVERMWDLGLGRFNVKIHSENDKTSPITPTPLSRLWNRTVCGRLRLSFVFFFFSPWLHICYLLGFGFFSFTVSFSVFICALFR